MFYEFDIMVPMNTSEAAAQLTEVKLQQGVITKASIQFPLGCAGLAHIKAKMGASPLWPRNEMGNIKCDGLTISIDEYTELSSGWNKIKFYTWNLDTKYDHMITVRMTVLPKWLASQAGAFEDIRNALVLLLRRIGVQV